MEERKLSKFFYEAVKIDVIGIEAKDIIATSGGGVYEESSGGNLDPNWDVDW